MNHQQFESTLSSYIDGELSAQQALEFESHLQECPACKMQMVQLQNIREGIRSAAVADLPDSFSANVLRFIRLQTSQSESWRGAERLAWRIVFALSILVVLIVGVGILNTSEQSINMERYLSGIQPDSAVQRVLLNPEEISKDDVLLAVVTR